MCLSMRTCPAVLRQAQDWPELLDLSRRSLGEGGLALFASSYGKALSAFRATAINNGSTIFGCHAFSKTVFFISFFAFELKSH
jgi:hypothetical protein